MPFFIAGGEAKEAKDEKQTSQAHGERMGSHKENQISSLAAKIGSESQAEFLVLSSLVTSGMVMKKSVPLSDDRKVMPPPRLVMML